MKICKTEQEYIDAIIEAVQKACKRYGYLPSVLIAQSCLENGYGIPDYWDNPQIASLLSYNNMVGIKSDLLSASWADKTVWPGQSLTKKTPEVYNGKPVIITDDFRIYDDIEQSFADFLLFMKYGAYSKGSAPKYGEAVLSIKDPSTLIKKVNALGYATSNTYADHVMKIVNKHNLTKYDDLSAVEPTIYTPGYRAPKKMNVIKLADRSIIDITARNRSQVPASRGSNPVKFIVIHYLGVPNADNPDLYGGGYGGHYNIERNGRIYKAANPKTDVVWQCGGGRQGAGGSKFFGVCTNYNSIGIENGVCYTQYGVKDPDDNSDKWYFTEETQESLVWLVSKLMDEYNISFDHVIRHYDVTGKICPNPYVRNNHTKTSWTWDEFKANLRQYRKDGTITIPNGNDPAPSPEPEPAKKWYRVRKSAKDEASQKGAYEVLKNAKECADANRGYKVFDWNFKCVYDPFRWKFLDALQAVVDTGREENWTYGDSESVYPCADKLCSCDRSIFRALYDLGFKDQRDGGEVCGTLDAWLQGHGWKKVTDKAKIVVAVRYTNHNYIDHVFTVVSYDPKTGICTKYDTGSTQQIRSKQPFRSVPLLSWGPSRIFVAAYNPPAMNPLEPEYKEDTSGITGATTYNGVDYSAVYAYSYYRKRYADLQAAFGNDKAKYFKHFIEHGMNECRQARSTFNPKKYRVRYKDLDKAFGDNWPLYYKHYCQRGKKENRKAT